MSDTSNWGISSSCNSDEVTSSFYAFMSDTNRRAGHPWKSDLEVYALLLNGEYNPPHYRCFECELARQRRLRRTLQEMAEYVETDIVVNDACIARVEKRIEQLKLQCTARTSSDTPEYLAAADSDMCSIDLFSNHQDAFHKGSAESLHFEVAMIMAQCFTTMPSKFTAFK